MQSLSRFSNLRPLAPEQDRQNKQNKQYEPNDRQDKAEDWPDTSGSRDCGRYEHIDQNKQVFERILTHTLLIQPEAEGQRSPFQHATSATPEKAVLYDVELNENLDLVAGGDIIIGHLPQIKHSSTLRLKRFGRNLTAPDWYASAKYLDSSGHVRLLSSFARHVNCVDGGHDNRAKTKAKTHFLPYHFVLTIEVHLNMYKMADKLDDAAAMAKSRLLHMAFVENGWRTDALRRIEQMSNVIYSSTDIAWFYACLQRPLTANTDRKGKGRLRDSVLRPAGLMPTLLPFQSRSLEWMLQREGRRVAGMGESGAYHELAPIPNPRDSLRLDSSLLREIALDSGTRLWINGITCEVTGEISLNTFEEPFEGSMAAEEMGLGKTVEILSLILMNQQLERSWRQPYLLQDINAEVQPTASTLLICPAAILLQWADEIERHAPNLRVLRYDGLDVTFPRKDKFTTDMKADKVDLARISRDYDIVLTTFDVLRDELVISRKPIIRTTRSNSSLEEHERVRYRRSLLISMDWLRVVVDEAQMAASTTSAISETASLIPRKYSWAVSGTPIKQTIADCAGLLKFLRVDYVGWDASMFSRLLEPSFAGVFSSLISRIGIRTTKSQVTDQLALPPQQRFIVPVDFSALESFNYRNRYSDALSDLGLLDELEILLARIGPDWEVNNATISRWVHLMRQACFHAQAGAPVQGERRATGNRLGGTDEDKVQTLQDVLLNLRERNIAELHSDQRALASCRVACAYRSMYDKEDCERYENAIIVLQKVTKDLHNQAEDIYSELLHLLPDLAEEQQRESREASSASAITAAGGHAYMHAFREAVSRRIEQANSEENAAQNEGRRAGLLAKRLRDTLTVMHQTAFFIGNAYFAIGDKPNEEASAYEEAEQIRKQLLRAEERSAINVIQKLLDRVSKHDNRSKCKPSRADQPKKAVNNFNEDDALIALSDIDSGLQSVDVFYQIQSVTEQANKIAKITLKWREDIIGLLSAKLADDEVSADEYQHQAERQECLDVFIEYLGRIISDWMQVVTGTRSALADNVTLGGMMTNTAGVAAKDISLVEELAPTQSRRSLYKTKAGIPSSAAAAMLAASTPGGKLRVELETLRKQIVPGEMPESLKQQLRNLNHLKDRVRSPVEEALIGMEIKRLRAALAVMNKVFQAITIDFNYMNKAYNARVTFFRALQDLGDSVAELSADQSSPLALRRHRNDADHIERQLTQSIMAKLARRRFLDSLRSQEAMEEDACLICSDANGQQLILTVCAHIFHEQCIKTWCSRAGARQCPVCRNQLSGQLAWQRIDLGMHKDYEIEQYANAKSITEADMPMLAEADSADPKTQLKYIDPKQLQHIKSQQLSGESLGSKLDLITKHIIYLRKKHEAALVQHRDQQDAIAIDTDATSPSRRGSAGSWTDTTAEALPSVAKILLFSGWQYAVNVLAAALKRERIGFVRLEGGAGSITKRKEAAMLEFKENPDVNVFILHAQSQAAGLNLIAAQYVILVEPLLQSALEVQAIARVHRIGQSQVTSVYQYVVAETIDEKIALLSLWSKGHMLFSRVQDMDALNAPAAPLASPGKNKINHSQTRMLKRSGAMDKPELVDEADEDDVAKILLYGDDYLKLQKALAKRALLQAERERAEAQRRRLEIANSDRFDAFRLGSEELAGLDWESD